MKIRKDMKLKRFQLESISGKKYVNISCRSGSVWITAGKGFDDIVLRAGESITVISDSKVIVEALSDCHIIYSASLKQSKTPTAKTR